MQLKKRLFPMFVMSVVLSIAGFLADGDVRTLSITTSLFEIGMMTLLIFALTVGLYVLAMGLRYATVALYRSFRHKGA
jgi:hypothetical protein